MIYNVVVPVVTKIFVLILVKSNINGGLIMSIDPIILDIITVILISVGIGIIIYNAVRMYQWFKGKYKK